MAEDIPGNSGISTERTLSEVVNELKRVNENEELSREVSINSQLAMEKLRDASTDQSTRAALIDLLDEMRFARLADQEEDAEDDKRDEKRNEILEKIAKFTSLSLDELKDAFPEGTKMGVIMGTLFRTAMIGTITGIIKGLVDSYKFLFKSVLTPLGKSVGKFYLTLGKSIASIGKAFGRLTGLDKVIANAVKTIRAFFPAGGAGGSSFVGTLKRLFDATKGIFNAKIIPVAAALTSRFMSLFKAIGTLSTMLAGMMTGTVVGKMRALNAINVSKLAKSFGAFGGAFKAFFGPLDGFFKLFDKSTAGLAGRLNNAGKSVKAVSNAGKNIGTTLQTFAKSFKPLKSAFEVLKTISGAFQGLGRVLGRFFLPITVIMSVWDGIKGSMAAIDQLGDASMMTKIFAGLVGAVGGILKGLIVLPLDFLRKGIAWLVSWFGEPGEKLAKYINENFNLVKMFQDIIDNMITAIGDLAKLDFKDIIKNVTLTLLKIAKKVAMFPAAVAAGGVSALAAAVPGGKSPGEAFMETFNSMMTVGDDFIDSLKTQTPTGSGQEMLEDSQENEQGIGGAAGGMPTIITDASATDASDRRTTNTSINVFPGGMNQQQATEYLFG